MAALAEAESRAEPEARPKAEAGAEPKAEAGPEAAMPPEPPVIEATVETPMTAEGVAMETPMIAEVLAMEAAVIAKVVPRPIAPWTSAVMELPVVPSHVAMEAPVVAPLGELDIRAGGPGLVAAALRRGRRGGERERCQRRYRREQQLLHLPHSVSRVPVARAATTR